MTLSAISSSNGQHHFDVELLPPMYREDCFFAVYVADSNNRNPLLHTMLCADGVSRTVDQQLVPLRALVGDCILAASQHKSALLCLTDVLEACSARLRLAVAP